MSTAMLKVGQINKRRKKRLTLSIMIVRCLRLMGKIYPRKLLHDNPLFLILLAVLLTLGGCQTI